MSHTWCSSTYSGLGQKDGQSEVGLGQETRNTLQRGWGGERALLPALLLLTG